MRNCVPCMARGIHQLLDLVEHGIQPGRQPVELVARSAHGCAPAQFPAHHGLGRPREFICPSRGSARNQDSPQQ